MTDKKPFSDSRWWEWPTEGVTIWGEQPKQVRETVQKWLKMREEKEKKAQQKNGK